MCALSLGPEAILGAIPDAVLDAVPDATGMSMSAWSATEHLRAQTYLESGGQASALVVEAGVHAVVLVWGLALAWIDLRERRLPRRLTVPAYPVAALLIVAAACAGFTSSATSALVGGCALRGLYHLARAVSPRGVGLGRGDVTLAAPLGAWLGWHGWHTWWWGSLGAFAISGVVALTLLWFGLAKRETAVPHGPAMILATIGAIWAGHL